MDQFSQEAEERPVRYASRQPILADDETVIGYRLHFRTGVLHHFSSYESDRASRTAIDMSSLLGLNLLCDNRLAFIDCTREILVENSLAFLPADKVVAEIGDTVTADEAVLEACSSFRKMGYKIALDNFGMSDPRNRLVELADFLYVDIQEKPWEDVLAVARHFGNHHHGLIAKKVETRHEFDQMRNAGFHYFQGYFFRKSETMRSRGIPASQTTYLCLLKAVSKTELDWHEIEEILKRDATIYYRLLRYLNSAIFGLRGEVRSASQALTILGEDELRRWCRLAGVFEMSRKRPSDLALSALVRARFSELIAELVPIADAELLFLVGLLSLMDAMLEIPMSAVLDGLALDAPSRQMLLENRGPLLPLYQLIWSLERGDWRSVLRACTRLGIEEGAAAAAFTCAMEWAQSVNSV